MTDESALRHGEPRRSKSLVASLGVSILVHVVLLSLLLTVALQVAPWSETRPEASAPIAISALPEPDRSLIAPQVDAPVLPVANIESLSGDRSMLLPETPGDAGLDRLGGIGDGVAAGPGPGGIRELMNSAGAPKGVRFAGLRTRRASRIVYVVDGSGAMVTSLPFVLDELARSVSRLDADQRFAVVLFRNRPPTRPEQPPSLFEVLAGPNGGMLRADEEGRLTLRDWIDGIAPEGLSNPLDGLTRAFDFRPDAVFLLARSIPRSGQAQWGVGTEAILRELERVNPVDPRSGSREASIKTIQFLAEDPTGTMRAIGERHGAGAPGEPGHTLLTLDELGALPDVPAERPDRLEPIAPEVEFAVEQLSDLRASRLDIAVLFDLATPDQRRALDESCQQIIALIEGGGSPSEMARFAQGRARMLLARARDDNTLAARARAQLDELAERSASPLLSALAGASAISATSAQQAGSADPILRLRAITPDLADVDPHALAEARISAIRLTSDAELRRVVEATLFKPPYVVDGERDAVLSVAAASAIAESGVLAGDGVGACRPLIDLLREGRIAPDAILNRIAAIVPDELDLTGDAPPEVLYAEGLARARAGIAGAPGLLARAASAEHASASVKAAAPRDAALALLSGPTEHASEQERVDAIETLWSYVAQRTEAPDRARVLVACLLACDRFMAGVDSERVEAVRRSATALFASADFAEGARRSSPESSRWISDHARNLLESPDPVARASALSLLEQIPRDAPAGAYAGRLRIYARSLDVASLRARLEEARRSGDSERTEAIASRIVEECRALAPDVGAFKPDTLDRLSADMADARVELGEAPVDVYESITGTDIPGGEARRLIGLARSHRNAGRPDLAFPILRDLAERLDAPSDTGGARSPVFWHAWSLMMEILSERGRDVGVHVLRLTELDPELGGEPWRSRILDASR